MNIFSKQNEFHFGYLNTHPYPRFAGIFFILFWLAGGFWAFSWAQVPLVPLPGTAKDGPEQKLVGIEVIAQFEPVPLGRPYYLAVILDIKEGWHLYANPKQGEFGLDTEIVPQPAEGLKFGSVRYPPGEKYVDKVLQASNHIYEGRAICHVPMAVGPDVAASRPGEVAVTLSLNGQLCSDAGVCRLWEDKAEVKLRVGAEGGTGTANRPELFEGLDASSEKIGDAAISSGQPVVAPTDAGAGTISSGDWPRAIVVAVAAGLVMNLTPCVWPIIPIVVLTLMKQCAPEAGVRLDRAKSIRVGLAFAGGIMIVFIGLAVVMSVFKLLWGEQFQGIGFKFVLLLIVFVLSLSMFGIFEIVLPGRISNVTVVRKGYLGALGMGMLATVLATPCGAPLLSGVLAWSLSKALPVTVAVFILIGVGMSLPYVVLTVFPQLLGRIPKAGNWMIRLKQAIGFAMLGFAAYLITLFPPGWTKPLLYLCVLVGFCVWLGLSVGGHSARRGTRVVARIVALVLLAGGAYLFATAPKSEEGGPWLKQLQSYQQQNRTVIVKFTADWCGNCKALDKLIYQTDTFQQKLAETNAALVVADWTQEDFDIKQMIEDLAGPGQALPFAAVFPGADPDHPILLRNFYSLQATLAALEQASAKK